MSENKECHGVSYQEWRDQIWEIRSKNREAAEVYLPTIRRAIEDRRRVSLEAKARRAPRSLEFNKDTLAKAEAELFLGLTFVAGETGQSPLIESEPAYPENPFGRIIAPTAKNTSQDVQDAPAVPEQSIEAQKVTWRLDDE